MNNKRKDIDKISFDILKQSKSLGAFPTPVEKIVTYAELYVEKEKSILDIPKEYFDRSSEALKRALRKINGMLDRKEKIIYLDLEQVPARQRFVQLHEVGHEVLPWQKKLYEVIQDDEITIQDVNDEFESEANYFASATLFQLDRFEEELSKLPLEIKSGLLLSKQFGASTHATLRRYVEYSPKRCALLVLEKEQNTIITGCKARNYFQSGSFSKEFGLIKWDESLSLTYDFVRDYLLTNKRLHCNGQIALLTTNGLTTFNYHFFNNTFNGFVFFYPHGEVNQVKTKIVVNSYKDIL